MSRPPFRPGDDRPQSPFDRPSPSGSGPPPSFKTNVNRNKTKKWVEARHNNYDGDDWGGFDPYDEYGSYDERPGDPSQMRKHSFDRGEERRAFSAGVPQGRPPMPSGFVPPHQPYAARPRTGSHGSKEPPGLRRDFSQPGQMPQPLHMRQPQPRMPGPGPQSGPPPPPSDQLPLREAGAADDGKPAPAIPFIRPSDIYKRMEQERERERVSTDSSRPSIEGSSKQDSAVAERPSPYSADETSAVNTQSAPGFQSQQPVGSGGAQEFQSLVNRAFDRPDDNSVPDTPASAVPSHLANQDLSRSNTDSTSGISPIMSRVPSSGNAESRGRAAAAVAAAGSIAPKERVDTISEESPLQSPLHAPNEPAQRRDVGTPSPHATPAMRPHVEERPLSQSMTAVLADDPADYEQLTAASYEAQDSVLPLASHTTIATGGTGIRKPASIEALRSQQQSSQRNSPLASPVNGRTSPFPGRVKDLAGKYDEIHELSRSNSQMSLGSKKSTGSLGRNEGSMRMRRTMTGESLGQNRAADEAAIASSADNLGPGQQDDIHTIQHKHSFRPALPGEWISTTDVRPEATAGSSIDRTASLSPDKALPEPPATGPTASELDLTAQAPSHAEHGAGNPLDALRAAGTALGESFQTSAGSSHQARDFGSDEAETPTDEREVQRPVVGDVFLRPLKFDRTASSVMSSAAPTPPAKDTPKVESSGPLPQYFHPASDGTELTESDRLREDIERSLSPPKTFGYEDAMASESQPSEREPTKDLPPVPADVPTTLSPIEEHSASASRPELLTQRFSWENSNSDFFNPSALGTEVDLPQTDLRVVNAEPEIMSPVEKTVSHDVQDESLAAEASHDVGESVDDRRRSQVSQDLTSPTEDRAASDYPSSPVTERPGRNLGRYSTEINASVAGAAAAMAGANQTDAATAAQSRIPPFREILAIKSPTDRISTYNSARGQFATMNTGLQDWLLTTMANNPEHDHLSTAGPSIIPGGPVPDHIRNRPGQSIVKLAKNLGSSKGDGPLSPSRDSPGNTPTRSTSHNYSSNSPQASANVEKMQAMGKDLLSSAGKLGGKSVVGAKGWLAKGRQKLRESSGGGGDKAASTHSMTSPNPSLPTPSSEISNPLAEHPDEDPAEVQAGKTIARSFVSEDSDGSESARRPRMPLRSSSTRSLRRVLSRTRTSSPLATPPVQTSPDTSPRLFQGPASPMTRPRLHQRSLSSWSGHKISATIDRIRSNVSEFSKTRARPHSLVLVARSPPTVHITKDGDEDSRPGTGTRCLDSFEESPPSGAWAQTWGKPYTPANPLLMGPDFRLGVLPSPGVESFFEAGSGGGRTPLATSPLRMSSLAAESVSSHPEEQERPRTSPEKSEHVRERSASAGDALTNSQVSNRQRRTFSHGDRLAAGLGPGNELSSIMFSSFGPPQSSKIPATGTAEPVDLEDHDGGNRQGSEQAPLAQLETLETNASSTDIASARAESDSAQTPTKATTKLFDREVEDSSPRTIVHVGDRPSMMPELLRNESEASIEQSNVTGAISRAESQRSESNYGSYTPSNVEDSANFSAPAVMPTIVAGSLPIEDHIESAYRQSPTAPTLREAAMQWPAPGSNPEDSRVGSGQYSAAYAVDAGFSGHRASAGYQDRQTQPLPFMDRSNTGNSFASLDSMSPQEAALTNERDDLYAPHATQSSPYNENDLSPIRSISLGTGGPAIPMRYSYHDSYQTGRSFSDSHTWDMLNGVGQVNPSTSRELMPTNQTGGLTAGPSTKGKLSKKDKRLSFSPMTTNNAWDSQPDKEKKKRFSFGSLFSRSKSGSGPPKPADTVKRNRLSKQGPMILSAPSGRQPSPEKVPPPPGYDHATPPSDQATLVSDDTHPRSHTPLSLSRRSSMHSSVAMGVAGMHQEGWTSPEISFPEGGHPEPTVPNVEPTRRLHSARYSFSKRFSQNDTPDTNRAGDTTYRSNVSPEDPSRSLPGPRGAAQRNGSPAHRPVSWTGQNFSRGPLSSPPASYPSRPSPSLSTGGAQNHSRRGSAAISSISGSSSRRQSYFHDQRSNSISQVSANQPPAGWAEYGGYYFEPTGSTSPNAGFTRSNSRSNSDLRPGQQSRHSSYDAYGRGANDQALRRNSSYVTNPVQGGIGIATSPSQTAEHDEWMKREQEARRREILAQQQQQTHPQSSGGYDEELYESTPRRQRQSASEGRMQENRYPGQTWAPPGSQQGNYGWE